MVDSILGDQGFISFQKRRFFHKSSLGKKLLFSILFFSTVITLFLTSIQIYIDYKNGINSIYSTVEQIKATQLESLAQNLWNINNEQIQIQLKGLLEIETIKGLSIIPLDDKPITILKAQKSSNDILNTYPIYYERQGKQNHLGNLEIISDISPVIETLKSRVLIILLTQGTKTFLVSSFILFIFNVLVNKHLFRITLFAREISLDNLGTKLSLQRGPTEKKDEMDDLAESLNIMQEKILREAQEKRNYQEQLLQSQKMEALGTLASGIAHDFNNILQGLYNALFILEEEVIDNADALQRLGNAGELVDRARELVKQILIYTKQQEGNFVKFGAIGTIQDVVNILGAAKPKNVSIDLFIDPPNGKLYGDQTQLKQVLFNLVNNAFHAVGDIDNASIKIKISSRTFEEKNIFSLAEGAYVVISVEDNGHGIKSENLQRVFEPFYTTKEIDQGTGLGLSVVQGIVHRHRGEITVESIEGRGTTFTVYLPLLLNRTDTNLRTITDDFILVTNDDRLKNAIDDNKEVKAHMLSCFTNAEEVLAHAKEIKSRQDFTYIIDQNIENFGPLELIRKLRQLCHECPMVLLNDQESLLPLNLRTVVVNRRHFIKEVFKQRQHSGSPTDKNAQVLALKNYIKRAQELI